MYMPAGKRPNPWIQHVKSVQKAKGLSWQKAIQEARKTWTPKSSGFGKGSPSKSRPGKVDFSTKKSSKEFDRFGHRSRHAQGSRVKRRPFGTPGSHN